MPPGLGELVTQVSGPVDCGRDRLVHLRNGSPSRRRVVDSHLKLPREILYLAPQFPVGPSAHTPEDQSLRRQFGCNR